MSLVTRFDTGIVLGTAPLIFRSRSRTQWMSRFHKRSTEKMLTIPASHLVAFSLAGDPPLHLSVLEVSDRDWWAQQSKMEGSNPFGAKLWPAALGVAEHLSNLPAIGWESVGSALDCCCGNGLVAITLAARGVPTVIASDISPLALEMTAQAAAAQQLTAVSTLRFDLSAKTALPDADLCVFADLFYEEKLGRLVAQRVAEAAKRGSWVVVGSHVRSGRGAFLERLGQLLPGTSRQLAFRHDDEFLVRSDALKWKEKRCSLLEFNTPAWARVGGMVGGGAVDLRGF